MVETVGVYPLAPATGRGESPRSAERNSSLDFKRKTPRPLGANTLTQFEYPAQSVLKKRKGIPFGTP